MWRAAFKVGGQVLAAIIVVVGLSLDGSETAEITLRQQGIDWQWIALAGALSFALLSVWTQFSLYRAFTDHSKYRKAVIDLAPIVMQGNALLDIHCRPESPTPLGPDVNAWIGESGAYIHKHYPEGYAYIQNDNIDFYDQSTPVSCRQIRGRLERLNEISREMRALSGGIAASQR